MHYVTGSTDLQQDDYGWLYDLLFVTVFYKKPTSC